MQYTDLTILARTLAAHRSRSLNTIARWAGVYLNFFERLESSGGCRVDTFHKVLTWFDENWPADLAWPSDIPRPSAAGAKKRRAA